MFLAHFALNAHPFAEKPPIEWLQRDPRIEQALARLKFFEQQGALALILGQTGLGKSSLLRLFIHELPHNRYHPLYLQLRLLLQILERVKQNEKCTLLIVDEAHLIDPDTLTDLRLLISSIDEEVSLKIVLCGQDNLKEVLKRASHADLVQRIALRFALHALSKEQSAAYIDNRMIQAGGTAKTFESEAKNLIHEYTGGVPRQINNVAMACLINAASRSLKKIDDALVNETMSEFNLP